MVSDIYNERLEGKCVRILYFFNSLDTYFLVAGILSFVLVFRGSVNPVVLVLSLFFAVIVAKIADFYPIFLLFSIPALIMLVATLNLPLVILDKLFFANIFVFFIIQFVFMGVPTSIVARDIRVSFIMMFNSLFTVAPTTTSFSMSVFYSLYLSFFMAAGASCRLPRDYFWLASSGMIFLVSAFISRLMLPKNIPSKLHKPNIAQKPLFEKVVILNIDGARKDIFDSLDLPTMNSLSKKGASHTLGLETVYRALTNPAFASILTGTTPQFHGIRNNNLGQSIETEGLPDVVPTIVYGSMHVKHFCKKSWETRVVLLARHSVYLCDDMVLNWLKDDMLARAEIRLFVVDLSEADFLAHAYGSKSRQYKQALIRTDKRIGNFIGWMETKCILDNTAVIICSDHGVAGIDHGYLIADPERHVPFIIYGKNIKKGFKIKRPGKIMDICCTVAYLLSIRYPANSKGQVFTEAMEGLDPLIEGNMRYPKEI